VIVSPTWTVTLAGENLKSTIVSAGSPAACARGADEDGAWNVGARASGVAADDCVVVVVVVVVAVAVVVVLVGGVVWAACVLVVAVVLLDRVLEFVVVEELVVWVVPGLAAAAIACSESSTVMTATMTASRAGRRIDSISSVMTHSCAETFPRGGRETF
jgi:hypothetical protein